MEIWLPIKNFPKYDVSSNGRIKNVITGKILKPGRNPKGYLLITLYKNGKPHIKKIHRLVADAFYDGEHEGLEVNHIDGDKTNNCIWNLEWCTGSENIKHSYELGLRKPPRMKMVKIIETGEIFESMSDCARSIGGTISGIYDCEKGRQSTHRGYHFKFI